MAKIVLGMGSSHGPMLSTPPEEWGQRVVADKRNKEHHYKGKTWTYEQLVDARKGEGLQKQIELPVWRERHAACRKALGELAKVFTEVKPDVAVIVGNDQKEVFRDAYTPALTVFNGKTITNTMFSDERIAALPPGIAVAIPGHIPPEGATYPGAPELAEHIIKSLTSDEFDVATLTQLPHDETPHAFGFIYRQIMLDQAVPSVPVILNTFYPPNQPSVRRCYEFGESLVQAIEVLAERRARCLDRLRRIDAFRHRRGGRSRDLRCHEVRVDREGRRSRRADFPSWHLGGEELGAGGRRHGAPRVQVPPGGLRAVLSLRGRHRKRHGVRVLAAVGASPTSSPASSRSSRPSLWTPARRGRPRRPSLRSWRRSPRRARAPR